MKSPANPGRFIPTHWRTRWLPQGYTERVAPATDRRPGRAQPSRLVLLVGSEQVAEERDLCAVMDEFALLMEYVVHERVVVSEAEAIDSDVEGASTQWSPQVCIV